MGSGVALVTGGGRGIGRACCLRAAKAGYTVVVNYRERGVDAEDVVERIEAAGGKALPLQADVSKPEHIARMFLEIESRFGGVDALVNNAGASEKRARGLDISLDRFRQALDLNLVGPFLCMQAAAANMRKRKTDGVIVNVSSYSVVTGGAKNHVDYAAAKAGLESLTRGLARELEGDNIRVNAVAPGTTDTDMWSDASAEDRAKIIQNIPLGRFGTPDEVATAVVWLLSPQARGVIGQIIPVNGGRCVCA